MRQRPSHKELTKKIDDGKESLLSKNGLFADPSKAATELGDLGIGDTKEVWSLIIDLLGEIKPTHYTDGRPPQKSYKETIEGLELFAFSWDSSRLSKKMYLKFALKDGQFYYVSLHKDRPFRQK